jgi:uncharacterized membrane protein
MTEFWTWVEMLPLAARIGESWWFPLLESIHVLTAMFVVGSILFVDLRLIGVTAMRYSATSFSAEILKWTWASFAIAFVTGVGMFITRAGAYVINRAFLIKLLLLGLAALNMVVFQHLGKRDIARWDSALTTSHAARIAGGTSLLLWIGVTLAGRWTGHLS